ncbi:rRNA adenine dimethylase [Cystobasidium minutum MCA 4210]|uniref:rRNA adenine dimethylase n=1 Tax=Cystobasidium minutum MCA 4210 TaxID=1397322 RepID=UPI0034CF91FB|eukprot:jgi/Rhomi1/211653/estExt_Genemark1.C_5_t10191
MGRATSEKLTRVHAPATISASSSKGKGRDTSSSQGGSNSAGPRNPLFNTERFGQHILINPGACQGIVDKANLRSTDKVLEVGPGTGNLTTLILPKCKTLLAVEADPRMASDLIKRVQGKPEGRKLEVIVNDVMKQELPPVDVCISNTPYQISSPLVFKLLSQRPLPRVCVLMFQREFALRLVARPGDNLWNRLSANAQLYAKIDHVMKLSKNSFRPPPNVESSVVRIAPFDPPPPVRFEEFDGLTRILFTRRNKIVRANFQAKGVKEMLESNYKAWRKAKIEKEGGTADMQMDGQEEEEWNVDDVLEEVLEETGCAEKRAAKMDVDEFLVLLEAFHKRGIHFGG